jgi:uncharacterized protein (TIGR03435 family)
MRLVTDEPSRLVFVAFLFPLFTMLGTALHAQDPRPSFEVASVKENKSGGRGQKSEAMPGRFTSKNAPLRAIIMNAYEIQQQIQLRGGPAWMDSVRFDIQAKVPSNAAKVPGDGAKAPGDKPLSDADRHQIHLMLQSLLAERFKLVAHHENKEMAVYFLVVAKAGSKLRDLKGTGAIKPPNPDMHRFGGSGSLKGLVNFLSSLSGRPVIDQTGLRGSYDYHMELPQDEFPITTLEGLTQANASVGAAVFAALERQLGLKLESGKAPVDVLVIDHVEKPSEN